jgi:hypothetical protein
MSHFRFTIAHLLGLVLFIAVGFAALREATALWDSAVFSVTLAVLSVSVLLALHRADRRRVYWLGFALFGWIYLGASLIPPIECRLLTTEALARIAARIPALVDPVAFTFSPDGSSLVASRPGMIRLWNATTGQLLGGSVGSTDCFRGIGHSIVALVLAYLGGHLSGWLFARGRTPTCRQHGAAL